MTTEERNRNELTSRITKLENDINEIDQKLIDMETQYPELFESYKNLIDSKKALMNEKKLCMARQSDKAYVKDTSKFDTKFFNLGYTRCYTIISFIPPLYK